MNPMAEQKNIDAIPRRGFFLALAAVLSGGVGAGSILRSWTDRRRSDATPTATPVVTIHPNAVARTEEGSPRHG